MEPDADLLRRFADEGAQEAFAELVRRKIDFVYAAALRQANGDAHLAQDVTQGVFLALACRASSLRRHAALTGWLYTTTRFLAAKAVRAQSRWQRREREAHAMNALAHETDPQWEQLRPVVDAALHELGAADRDAILLRFFEGRSFAEVGAAIGLAENSARMRVERALEKLRGALERRGVSSTAAALGIALAHQPAVAAPAGFAATVAGAAFAGAPAAGAGALGGAAWLFTLMGTTKLVLAGAGAIALLGLGAYLGGSIRGEAPPSPNGSKAVESKSAAALAALRTENQRLRADIARDATTASGAGATAAAGRGPAIAGGASTLEALRVLTDLQRRKLVTPEVKLLTEGAKLTPEFAELFGLSPAEQQALELGWEAAREKLNVLERENTVVSRAPNGDVRLEIKPFPETGGAVYDAMLKNIADTLGPERYQAFLALGAEQAEKSLSRFGATLRDVTVGRETLPGGEVRYRIRARASSPPRDNWNYTSELLTADRFREEANSFLHLLPADFMPKH